MSTIAKFTLAEYDRMIALGIFDPPFDRRIELLHGELIEMTPPGHLHENVIDSLAVWSAVHLNPAEARARIRRAIALPDSDCAPQPDVCWVKAKSYSDHRPAAGDSRILAHQFAALARGMPSRSGGCNLPGHPGV